MSISYHGDSDRTIQTLISHYSDKTMRKAMASARTGNSNALDAGLFMIEPYIDIQSYTGVSVGFRIGNDRMYVIKDLQRFSASFKKQDTNEYGGNLGFLHNMDNLDDNSKHFARFILTNVVPQKAAFNQYNSYVDRSTKKYIDLDGYLFDDFFSLCIQLDITKLKLKQDNISITATLVKKNPPIKLNLLRQETDNFKLSIECVDTASRPYIMRGGEHTFVLIENVIYCCDPDYSRDVTDLLVALTNNWRGLNVARDDMQVFSSAVLKPVKRLITLNTDANTRDFEAPPLASRLYLDMQVEDFVTARLVFYYGNKKHDAFKQKDLNHSADLQGEYEAEAIVSKYFKNIDTAHNYAYIDNDRDAMFELVNSGLDELNGCVEVYATEKFKGVSIKPPPSLSVGVSVNSNLLDLTFDIGDYDKDELLGILDAYRQSKRYFRVKNGSFVTLEEGSLKTLFELVEGLDIPDKDIISGKSTATLYRALYLDSLIKQDSRIKFDRDSSFKKIIRDIKYVSDSDFAVPPSLTGTIRSYQKEGFRWMKTIGAYGFCGILADDMGLGKTLQVITLLLSAKLDGLTSSSIVVCPASLVLNWQSELSRFAPELSTVAVMGTAAERGALIAQIEGIDVVITSYDLMKRDVELYNDTDFLYQIIDEAQYIKNHATQNAIAVKSIRARHRVALTGTPVENSLSELWSIYDFLMPGYLYSYSKFKRKFEIPIVREDDTNALNALKRLVSPFILRRMKADVLKELPPRVETTLYAGLEGEQKRLYDANVALVKRELEDNGEFNRISVLAMLTKLRQICCTPSLLYEDYQGESAKLEMCIELVESCIASGHKLLLFSQFTSMLKLIEYRLAELGVRFYKITGSTRAEDRLNLVNSFNSDDTPVFLISLKAGGTGLNLTGADVVIHFDPWWNIAAQNQATDRAHRIGQRNSVQIYKLIAKDTIEEKIINMQSEKERIAKSILSGSDGSIAQMSKNDIASLFL